MKSSPVSPQEAAAELLKRRQARNRLIPFCTYTLRSYEPAAHLQIIAERLEALERGDIKRLMVFSHPRSGKSELVSIRFAAWYLGRHPQNQIIGCSYAESLAYSNSYAVRETIESNPYQRLWPITLDRSGAVRWQLADKENKRASYIAAGVGGGITGEGADLLIIDDPVKNKEEAESVTYREKTWDWYRTVARTRLQPNAAIVLIMTRWHKDDLAGRLLTLAAEDPNADQWEVLHLKAISDDGQALWPERYPVKDLEQIKASIGSRDFTALYQGSPTEAEGNIFKREWWRYYRERPVFKQIIQSWDTAFGKGEASDYSVCQTWGETDNGYYLLDVWRERVEFPELKKIARMMYERDRPNVMLVEDKASGQSLIQELQRETTIPVKPIDVDKDKVARANAVTPLIEAGRVYLPEYAQWLHNYIEELSAFPIGTYDDQVDATTQALNYLSLSRRYAFGFV